MESVQRASRSFYADLTLGEISGSLGDLGTFLPLLIGLVEKRGLDLGTTLIFTGVYNILSGYLFKSPIPVQPMKAIAAVALSEVALTVPEIMAAGIFVGLVTFVLGITRLINVANSLIPLAVVRGLQLGVGLNLAQKGVSLVWFKNATAGSIRDLSGSESLFLGLFGAVFILLTVLPYETLEMPAASITKQPTEDLETSQEVAEEVEQPAASQRGQIRWRIPAAFVIVVLGVVLTLGMHSNVTHGIGFGPVKPQVIMPTAAEWKRGIWRGGIPQIPLTLLNSVIAVCQLSGDLFPNKAPSAMKVSTSVGLMNLVGTWFGALPCCHGAGGLAAQYRFGARTGVAPMFLGLVKLLLGLLFGSSLHRLLQAFPTPLLGSMLIFSGAELASTCRNQTGQTGSALMLITTAAIMGMHNTGAGFVAGAAASAIIFIADRSRKLIVERRSDGNSGRGGSNEGNENQQLLS